jgi:hypothetical protein
MAIPDGSPTPGATVMMMQPGSNMMMPVAMPQGTNMMAMPPGANMMMMAPGTNIMMMPQVLGGTPGFMPGSMPGGMPGGMTGSMLGGMPGGMPCAMPGGMPGSMPSGMLGGAMFAMGMQPPVVPLSSTTPTRNVDPALQGKRNQAAPKATPPKVLSKTVSKQTRAERPTAAAPATSQTPARPPCPEAVFVDLSCLREKKL